MLRKSAYSIHKFHSFIRYFMSAKTIYNIHSPFLFSMLSRMTDNRIRFYDFDELYVLRKYLEKQNAAVPEHDLGAGATTASQMRTIKHHVKNSVSPIWQCEWNYRLIEHIQPGKMLELGTSFGLSSLYIARSNPKNQLITLEGNPYIQSFAEKLFRQYGQKNIKSICANIDERLASVLSGHTDIDLIYLDANHRYEPTMRYYELFMKHLNPRIILVDDIYWSEEMTMAWKEMKDSEHFNVAIDLYYFGILMKVDEIRTPESFAFIPYKYKPWQSGFFG